MAAADVSYMPGVLTAVVGDQCWALVEAAPDSPAVARVWQRLGRGAAADTLLAGLVADGLDGVAGFTLLVAGSGGQHRLFCRGTVGATVVGGTVDCGTPPGEGQAVTTRIDGAGLLTWREQVIDGADRIFLGEPPADTALRLPATSGVLLADCVIIDLTITMTHPGSLAGHVPDPAPVALPASPVSPATETAGGLNGGVGNDGEYDFLWGDTQARSVEGAAMRGTGENDPVAASGHLPRDGIPTACSPAVDPPVGGGTGAFPGGPPATYQDSQPSARHWQGPADPVRPGGLIDVPPWLSGSGASGATVKRGDLPDPVGMTTPPDRIGPVVPALICPSGHVNPPSDVACRRCGGLLPHDPVPVPRPVLGVLRLSLGDVITLDRGVLMGRSPRTDFGGADGEERPHVVKLPSAGGEISRTHLRVSLDGWHVLITDLNSTNGTLVTLPGRAPQQLRPGEPVPMQPGTVVTLAEGIDFRYEAAG